MTEDRKIVMRVEAEEDPRDIYCTTYQMRNPFHSFADAVASELDVFCYFQHAFAADLVKKDQQVLDICCGRGLLIPFLRYRRGNPELYVGVDIHPKNARWREGIDPRRRGSVVKEDGWGFRTLFVESAAEEMAAPILAALAKAEEQRRVFDVLIYSSSIEHMQPDAQKKSLQEAASLAHGKSVLYLTCPVTPEGKDGFDTQYRAHIYEPSEKELRAWLDQAGWKVDRTFGLVTKSRQVKEILTGEERAYAKHLSETMPRELALVVIANLFPECATEKAFLCSLKKARGSRPLEDPPLPTRKKRGVLALLDKDE